MQILDKNVKQSTVQNHNWVTWRVFYVSQQFQSFLSLKDHSLEEDADAILSDVCQIKPCEEEESLTNSSNPCVEPIKKHFYEGYLSPVYIRNDLDVEFEICRKKPDSDVEVRCFWYSFILISYAINIFRPKLFGTDMLKLI